MSSSLASSPHEMSDGDFARSRRYTPLLTVACAFAVGIGLDAWLALPVLLSWITAGVALGLWRYQWSKAELRSSSVSLLVAVAFAGAAAHHDRWRWYAADELGLQVTTDRQPVAIDAELIAAPVVLPAPPKTPLTPFPQEERTRLELRLRAVRDRDQWRPASGEATAFVDGVVGDVAPGDVIRLFGFASRIAGPSNPGEPDFAAMARREHRLTRIQAEFPACVSLRPANAVIAAPTRSSHWLATTRERFRQILHRHVSPERAPLAAALLLGTRESLSYDEQQRFLLTGTIHLLAISGMNLAILTWSIGLIARWIGVSRNAEIVLVGGFAIGYAMLTGAEPPVIRAAVIVVTSLLARWGERGESPWNTLALAAIIVLAINPTELFSLGTQLSFLAVAVLNATSGLRFGRLPDDPLDRLIWTTRSWWHRAARWSGYRLLELSAVGLAIWFFTQPLSWLHFHIVSPVAIPLNLVAAIPANLALLLGFFALLADLLHLPWLPDLLGGACSLSLDALDRLVRTAEWGPPAYAYQPAPPAITVALLYVGWTLGTMVRPVRMSILIAGSCVWLALALAITASWGSTGPAAPRLTFVSVGHGLATIIELPDGQTLLYDSGRLGQPEPAARTIANVLLARGKTRIDAVILSHADLDHYNAVPELLERFDVGIVYVSPVMFDQPSPALNALRAAVTRKSVRLAQLRAGDRLRGLGETTMEVLHPGRRGELGNDNANSMVMQLEYRNRRVLLTGDLEGPGLAALLNESPRQVDVLLAPHHGSRNSNPFGLSQWASPKQVIISGGAMDETDASKEVVVAYSLRGATVWHTHRDGAVTVELSPDIAAQGHRRETAFHAGVR